MFNSRQWSQLTETTYGYPSKYFKSDGCGIWYSHVSNDIGEYLIAPSFGDFIILDEDGLHGLEKWIVAIDPKPVSIKICCDFYPTVANMSSSQNGYIHQIEYDTYLQWYEEIVSPRFKRNIKKSVKNDLNIKIEQSQEAMRQFWEMHALLRQKKFHEIPQPWAYFDNIYSSFFKSDQGFILAAYSAKNELVAGILVLLYQGTAYYKFNASDVNHLDLRPNNILIDRLIYHLDGMNIKRLNLGYTGSSPNYEGLRVYKLSAGAKEYNRYTLRSENFEKLNRAIISEINENVQALLNKEPSLDDVDRFSAQYYKYFI